MATKSPQTQTQRNLKLLKVNFQKNQLLAADRFRDRRDILTALLSPDETYTVKAVEQMIENYLKGQVK